MESNESDRSLDLQTGRRPQMRTLGVTLLAIYHLVIGVGSLVAGTALAWALIRDIVDGSAAHWTALQTQIMLALAAFSVLGMVSGAFLAATGYGLWRMRGWARITALCFAAISMFAYPVGTLVGAVTFVYLIWFQRAVEFD